MVQENDVIVIIVVLVLVLSILSGICVYRVYAAGRSLRPTSIPPPSSNGGNIYVRRDNGNINVRQPPRGNGNFDVHPPPREPGNMLPPPGGNGDINVRR